MKFKYGESYLWLFGVYLALFAGAFMLSTIITGRFNWGILIMPAFLVGMLIGELNSGVALDSWWRAAHKKGTGKYTATIAWHCVGVLLFLGFSYFFIR